MERAKDYLKQAEECRALAAKALLPNIRAFLLQMGDRWEELARERGAQRNLQEILAQLQTNGDDHTV